MPDKKRRQDQLYKTLKIKIFRDYGEGIRALGRKKKKDLESLRIVQELQKESDNRIIQEK
jgi:hypothetical protein